MPRPDVRVARKNQILDTAAIVFAKHGFHQARMDDIVQESGLSKGAIYWYFKSKDDIIAGLLQRFFDPEMHQAREILNAPGTVRERLILLMQLAMKDVQNVAHQGLLPLFYEYYALATRQEETRAFLQSYVQSYRAIMTALIEQGIARGEFRTVDVNAVSIAIPALLEGFILIWIMDSTAGDLEQQTTIALNLFFDGLSVGMREQGSGNRDQG